MIKSSFLTVGGKVGMPDLFVGIVGKGTEVEVHHGIIPDVVVVTAKGKNLSKENLSRIAMLINGTSFEIK